ncbi:MAG: Gfo/Idh/MocA family oxidoreductase [Anaerolineae bacterium]|nr:Gfo/Idh/MocA family oxidoreductase [Anaerolineae bacterium]
MFMGEKKNLAVIGCGYWGKNYIRLLSQMADTNLVAICDRDKEALKANQTRILSSQSGPRLQLFTDYNDMLKMDNLDAVVICTSPDTHAPIAKAAIEAGKHILVEKPMTMSSDSAREVVEAATMKGLTLMVGHIFLYNSAVTKVKEYIEHGDLGQVYYMYAKRTNLGPIRKDVNALWDLAPHDISIFNHFMANTPEWVSATACSFLRDKTEDVGFITLGYPNKTLAHIHVSWADPHKEREVVVVGSEQRVVFNDVSQTEKVKIYHKGVTARKNYEDFGDFQMVIRDGEIVIPAFPMAEPLREQVQHFINCIDGFCESRSNGYDGLAVVRILEAIDRSVQSFGKPIYL